MFACLYLPPPAESCRLSAASSQLRAASSDSRLLKAGSSKLAALAQIARDFSPRVETHGDRIVTLDIGGLERLIGPPRTIGEELRRTAADAGLRVHIAVAATAAAAMLLAYGRAGLTVVPAGEEASALAVLPVEVLYGLQTSGSRLQASRPTPDAQSPKPVVSSLEPITSLSRWGLRTLGDLAALSASELSARLGQEGVRWQRLARGEDARPLVPAGEAARFEESLELEWPLDELEPLSFVLARLFEPLCQRLEREDRGVVTLHVRLTLVTSASTRSVTAGLRENLDEGGRELHERTIDLPAPMRDPRVLRTLAMLDLESNPPPAPGDRVSVSADVTEGRVLQFGLFARALPADKLATLLARLNALAGSDRVGAPSLVDTYRPGAFAMAPFAPSLTPGPVSVSRVSPHVLRRFRSPIPARVMLEQERPVRVQTDRRGFGGGRVERAEGPWRSSGDWWKPSSGGQAWNCDEWDVTLSDGTCCRISQSLDEGKWWVNGVLD